MIQRYFIASTTVLNKLRDKFALLHRIASKDINWLPIKTEAQLIFADERSTPLIAPLIPSYVRYLSVPVRGDTAFLNLKIFYHLIFSLPLLVQKKCSLQGIYLLAISRAIRGRVIISTIDNNSWGNLCDFSELRVLSIQNGLRNSREYDPPMSKQDIYVGLSRTKPAALRANRYVGIGSLFCALAGIEARDLQPDNQKSIVYVSQFRAASWNSAVNKVELKLARWTHRYAIENDHHFYLAPDSIRNPHLREKEIVHYRSVGLELDVPSEADRFTNIQKVASARLVVGHSSTLLIEALAMGVPTLCGINVDKIINQKNLEVEAFDAIDGQFMLPQRVTYEDFRSLADAACDLSLDELNLKVSRIRERCCEFVGSEKYLQSLSKVISRTLLD